MSPEPVPSAAHRAAPCHGVRHAGARPGACGASDERVQTPRRPVWGQATVMPWADAHCFLGPELSPATRVPVLYCYKFISLFFSVFFIVVKYTNIKLTVFKHTFSDINYVHNTVNVTTIYYAQNFSII